MSHRIRWSAAACAVLALFVSCTEGRDRLNIIPDIVLVAPADSVFMSSTNVTFSWTPFVPDASYRVIVATDPSLANVTATTVVSAVSATLIIPDGTYYWSVRYERLPKGFFPPRNSAGVRKFTVATGTSPGAPPAPALIAPTNGEVLSTTTIQFKWTYVAAATQYVIQVSTVPTFATLTLQQTIPQPASPGNVTYTTSLPEGPTYYWQVYSQNSAGAAPSTTFSFKIATGTLAGSPPATSLVSPVDGAILSTGSVQFVWTYVPNVTQYVLQVATDNSFSSVILQVTVNQPAVPGNVSTTQSITDGQRFWRVFTFNSVGGTPSVSRYFVVATGSGSGAPPATTLIAPPNNSQTTNPNVTFTWTYVAGASQYALQVSTTPDFSNVVIQKYIPQPAAPGNISNTENLTALGFNSYYWKVYTFGANFIGTPSVTFLFYYSPYPPPTLVAPLNGSILVTATPKYIWQDLSGIGVAGYVIQVSTLSNFSTLVTNQSVATNQFQQPSGLADGTYYWRVKSTGPAGESPFSEPWSFVVDAVPPFQPIPPRLIKPMNNAKIPANPKFEWTSTSSAKYRIQVSLSSSFTTTVIDTTVATTTYSPTTALGANTYHWHVRGLDPADNPVTPWSLVRRFHLGVVGGDLNGDVKPDLAIGSWNSYDLNGDGTAEDDVGRLFVFKGTVAAGTYNDGNANLIINGEAVSDLFSSTGVAVADINGDGNDDLIVGAPYNDAGGADAGRIYIWFTGPTSIFSTGSGNYSATTANVIITGTAGAKLGFCVDNAGDLNGDGFYDFTASAIDSVPGKAFVFFGKPNWSPTMSSSNANIIINSDGGPKFGFHNFGTAGDFNGDGFDDLIISSYRYDNGRGRVYILFGKPEWATTTQITLNLPADANVILEGEQYADSSLGTPENGGRFGFTCHKVGDINKDGFSDVMVGAGYYDSGPTADVGKTYVFYGSASPPSTIQASAANFTVTGVTAGGQLGCGVQNSCGDVNGDGFSDLVIGGESHNVTVVFYGSATLSGNKTMNDYNARVVQNEQFTRFLLVTTVGDINGDGIDDICFGGHAAGGRVYLFHGGTSFTSKPGYPSLNASQADIRITGSAAQGADRFGSGMIGTPRF